MINFVPDFFFPWGGGCDGKLKTFFFLQIFGFVFMQLSMYPEMRTNTNTN
jgi:hypothetical protein